MQRFLPFDASLLMVAALLLSACGGGSGESTVPVSGAVVINSSTIVGGETGVAYLGFTFSASGGSGGFTWTETGTLPPGLSLSPAGQLSGTPVTAGTYPFTVTATDWVSPSLTGSMNASIKIDDSLILISTSPMPPTGLLTHPYTGFAFAATGGSLPFTWSLKSGTLPAGLTLGSDGSITGTVALNAVSSTFTVAATDSAQTPQSVPQSFTVAIADPGPPVIAPMPSPPAGVNGTVYPGFSFTATGGLLPLIWKLTSGALPDGLTLGTDGSLTGTPTLAGTFNFTVTVTDSAATPVPVSLQFSVVITNPPPPTINTTAPPTATVGAPYSFQFSASDGLAPLVWSETTMGPALPNLAVSMGGLLSGTPSGAGIFPITVSVIDQLKQPGTPTPFTVRVSLARPAAAFTPTTGSMTIARSGHTATLLANGKVLLAGGPDASAELYDPASEIFTVTGAMTIARSGHTATLLTDPALPNHGKVLVTAGGSQTAELYDSTTGMFTATGSLLVPHDGPTATLLQNGQVLIAGGGTASAEIFNPATGTFTATGSMTIARTGHSASQLTNGQVLIAGGGTATAELYNPTTGMFTATGSMGEVRSGHTAALLTDGRVLIAGTDVTAELYSALSGTFSSVGDQLTPGLGATSTLRNDGTVLVAGGRSSGRGITSRALAELFAPEAEGFVGTGSLITARDGHTATLLADGTVLVAGGAQHTARCRFGGCIPLTRVLSSAELFK
jgi:WD40 repeat protein